MLPVRTNHLLLVVAIQVAAGGAFGWSDSGWGQTHPLVAAPSPVMFAQAADTSTAADPGGSNGDEMPNSSQRPAASTGGDEVPTALAPANPEPSSAAAQSATSSSGDEVPSPTVVPDAVGALPSKSSAGAPGAPRAAAPSARHKNGQNGRVRRWRKQREP